jgi:hypothetical protein
MLKRDPDKLAAWRERSRRLNKSSSLNRGGKIAPVNQARKARRKEAGDVYGPYHRTVASFSCIGRGSVKHIVCESFPGRAPIESHHVRSVGAGGKDEENTVPVCPALHDMIEGKVWGWTRSRVEREILNGRKLDEIAIEIAPRVRERMDWTC